jgi:WD40 repeat protein
MEHLGSGCTDHTRAGIVITWQRWQFCLAVLGVILYFAMSDWDAKIGAGEQGQPVAQIAQDDYDSPIRSLVYSGSTHLAFCTSSKVCLENMLTGQAVFLRDWPGSFGLSPVFSPDGQIVAIGGNEPVVRMWDVWTGIELEPLRVGTEAVRCIAFSPDGTTLAVATWTSPIVTLWDWPGRRRVGALDEHRGYISALAFSSSGSRLLTANSAAEVRLWDVASRKEQVSLKAHNIGMTAVALAPGGSLFATASFVDEAVRLWDTESGESRGSLPVVPNGVTGVAFSPDGKTLATSRRDGIATLWDLASSRQLGAVRTRTGSLQAITFSGDGRVFATGGFDGSIRFWDITKIIEKQPLEP